MKTRRKKILIFLGPPGSGKGTQTDRLAERLKLPAVSPGELLRQEVEKGTAIGKKIKKIMTTGSLIDNKIVEKLLDRRLASPDAEKGVIFDGFPRNLKQAPYLERRFADFDKKKYDIRAVYIHISDQEIRKRISLRRTCFCGATYHLLTKPPKKPGVCDVCARELTLRPDDKPAAVARRMKIFHRENDPILKYFAKKKILLKINGEQAIAKVQKDISEKLGIS